MSGPTDTPEDGPDFTAAIVAHCARAEAGVYAASRLYALAYEGQDPDHLFAMWQELRLAVAEMEDAVDDMQKAIEVRNDDD